MSIDRDPALLIDIANACDLIGKFIRGTSKPEFDADQKLQSALLHQLLILGEAARQLSTGFRAAHPEVDWSGYIGQRNVLIHRYLEVDLDKVWRVVEDEIPELRRWIQPWLPDEFFENSPR